MVSNQITPHPKEGCIRRITVFFKEFVLRKMETERKVARVGKGERQKVKKEKQRREQAAHVRKLQVGLKLWD